MHRRMKGMQVGPDKRRIPDERGSQFITKFNGTHLDWFRFWNQFESDIEKSELFPCLKLFLPERVGFPKSLVTHR